MVSRRKFLAQSSIITIGTFTMVNCKQKTEESITEEPAKVGSGIVGSTIGLQLYTVRDDMGKDPIGTLKKLAEIGYTDVECAGYNNGLIYGMDPQEFKTVLNDLGLQMNSAHVGIGSTDGKMPKTLRDNFNGACEDLTSIGVKYVICPYLMDFDRKGLDDYKAHAELFNKSGEIANQNNLRFGYHHHDFEFIEMDGQIPFDYLLANTDTDKVCYEIDFYWMAKGNKDAVEYITNNPGRFELWHIKDMDDTPEQGFSEVGNGVIDWNKVFVNKEVSGMKYLYVEQDQCKNFTPLESVKISLDYLKAL
jgi:sugar phosphate isomerase/epimerase